MMEKIFIQNLNYRFNSNGSFSILSPLKTSKTLQFFDDLYTSSPKFRIKWEALDELEQDLLVAKNSLRKKENRTQNQSINSTFLDGYKNNLITNKIYEKSAKTLQQNLNKVPIFVILNGQGEIALANSTNSSISNVSYLSRSFSKMSKVDSTYQENKQIGLFFFSKQDAEIYLKEIALNDIQGTKSNGLAIHCFGLDFAYRIMRHNNANVDFRFVPDLEEIKKVCSKKTLENPNIVFEDEQQQLRFRWRNLTKSIFWTKNDYFKGVPIYLISIDTNISNHFNISELYNETISFFDNLIRPIVKVVNIGIGFGNNNVAEGSFDSVYKKPSLTTYVFFDKESALKFSKQHKKGKIIRYPRDQYTVLNNKIFKPKILVYNLEDFLEKWEKFQLETDSFYSINSDSSEKVSKRLNIIPSSSIIEKNIVNSFNENTQISSQKVYQFLNFKYKRFKSFIDLVLNAN